MKQNMHEALMALLGEEIHQALCGELPPLETLAVIRRAEDALLAFQAAVTLALGDCREKQVQRFLAQDKAKKNGGA